jgi:hypothetical protein
VIQNVDFGDPGIEDNVIPGIAIEIARGDDAAGLGERQELLRRSDSRVGASTMIDRRITSSKDGFTHLRDHAPTTRTKDALAIEPIGRLGLSPGRTLFIT